ncbi:hypothetical protein SCUP234_08416 [Seiridium cupressi]
MLLRSTSIVAGQFKDTKDIVTIYGSVVAKNNVPEKVAFVVAKLKEAGAVVLGETTAAEWNSNNLEHDIGALSGGSGAALGANFAVLADTPGPMVRTVTGCALMLDCMVGFDPGNDFAGFAATAAAIGLPRGGSYAAHLEDRPPKIKKAISGSYGTVLIETPNRITCLQRSRANINVFLAAKSHLPQDLADILTEKIVGKSYLNLGVPHRYVRSKFDKIAGH